MTIRPDDESVSSIKQNRRRHGRSASPKRRKGQHKRLLTVGVGALLLCAACGASGMVLGHQVSSVRNNLEQTAVLVTQLRAQLEDGKDHDARETFDSMQSHAAIAKDTVTGPLWKTAGVIPIVGSNFRAVTEVAVSADDVVRRAVGPLLETYSSLDWAMLSPSEGRIDIAQLQDASPSISAASNTVRLSYERMSSINLDELMPQVAAPIRSATEQLRDAAAVLGDASSAAQLLPPMLGNDSPRQYLILVQNSAEARATGGIPGAWAVLRVANGEISLGAQGSAAALGAFKPPIEVDPEQTTLYTERLGTQMQNVNLTPDFPTVASTAKDMWEKRHVGQTLDGVLALDPVVLRNLIGATGPVSMVDPEILNLMNGTSLPVTLTAENVVSTLISDVYKEINDPGAQDAYFSAVAGQIFAAFTEGTGDNTGLMQALRASTQENRLYVWAARPSEQGVIASTALSGSVLGTDAGGASFGLYFNDGTGAKMDFYASRTAQLIQICSSGEYSSYTVRMTVTNNAPEGSAALLPSYVTGGGAYGVKPGNIRTNYVFYGPAQAFADTARVNGQPVPIGAGKHGQRPVSTVALELPPGETAELDVTFSQVVQDSDPKLRVTPGVEPTAKVILTTERATCD